MELDVATLRLLLASHQDQQAQAKVLEYFDYLTQTYAGWEQAARILMADNTNKNDQVEFFCLRIMEHFLKTRYAESDDFQQNQVRQFIKQWIMNQAQRRGPASTRNKSAQIVALTFLVDYPTRWPTFFQDLLSTLATGALPAIDFYLRVLHTINGEIADKDISHTPQELARNTLIKDSMRDQCVRDLVASWLTIVKLWPSLEPAVVSLCLDVVGSYVAWIDIGLVANDEFVASALTLLARPELREAAADCLREIIAKGMDPRAKASLVESFLEKLTHVGAFQVIKNDEDSEYVVKLSRLMNVMGTSLLEGYTKLMKGEGNTELLNLTYQCINNKVPYLLAFLNSESEDVSLAIAEFAREYIIFLKQQSAIGRYGQQEKSNVESLLTVIFNRYKYDDFYNFNDPGEGEAVFDDYRKTLKVLFDNIAHLDKELVLGETTKLITSTLPHWQTLGFPEVEVALAFLYLLAESLPSSPDCKLGPLVAPLVRLAVTSGVVNHGHMAINREYFEMVLRYEKVLAPDLLPQVLASFLDARGLAHPSPKIRSRVSYLFSRFIRAQRAHIQAYISEILLKVQEMLKRNFSNDGFLCFNDQLNLYEAAAHLIISATSLDALGKRQKLDGLLRPVIAEFETCHQRLQLETDEQARKEIAELMNHAIEITCKTSKAFSNQQSMKACACTQIYLDSLTVFLRALQTAAQADRTKLVQAGVRKLLHRLVVCLEEELLPFITPAAFWFLAGDLPELVPLLNQVIAKYKKDIVPFLQSIFTPFVQRIFEALNVPLEPNDLDAQREKQMLQRNYYAFIASIVTNNVVEAIPNKEMLNYVLLSIVKGAVETPDPVAQKTCFTILRTLVETWGGSDVGSEFVEFIYQSIIPACFMAPLKDSFDLSDAQTSKALMECGLCIRAVYQKRGNELPLFLTNQYFRSLQLPEQLSAEFCHNLVNNPKNFKAYIKTFFQQIQTT